MVTKRTIRNRLLPGGLAVLALCALTVLAPQAVLASPAAGTLCEISGTAGNVIPCPLRVASKALNEPSPTSIHMGISYPKSLEINQMTDGEFCVGLVCVPYTIPIPSVTLQSGHTISLEPPALWQWKDVDTGAGSGDLLLLHQQSPETPLSNAFLLDGELSGDEVVMEFQVTLTEDIPSNAPAALTLEWIVISQATGQPLRVEIEESPALLITSEITLACEENGTVCDDSDACTINDSCIVGVCFGQPVDCDDDNPCTSEECDPSDGCSVSPLAGECDDDDPCSVDDFCAGGLCAPGAPLDCEDGIPCTQNKCVYGVGCDFDTTLDCDDGDICTSEECDEEEGCIYTTEDGGDCADPNPCTLDLCDPVTGCLHTNLDGVPCTDENACTTNETCGQGVCLAGSLLECDDNNACTTDTCDPAIGCVSINNTNACDDGDACTVVDECVEGVCLGEVSLDCDDDDPCTQEICVPATGCLYTLNDGAPCTDGLICNDELAADQCQGGACVGAPCPCTKNADCGDDGDKCNGIPSCHPFLKTCINGSKTECDDDGAPCMDPKCDPILGICTFINLIDETPCTDGSLCTSGGFCWKGDCLSNVVGCNDSNYCTTDFCDSATGACIFEVVSNEPCSDGDVCTSQDTCLSGLCTGLSNTDCDDGNPCTDDVCDSDFGCLYDYNESGCEDGNACTSNDICLLGECLSGGATDCDDDDLCTVDICKSKEGCLHPSLDCNDDDLCNGEETCHPIFGCQPTEPPVCVDTDSCTSDGCDPKIGCTFYDVCGPGPFTFEYSPTAIEAGVERTLTFTGKDYSTQTKVLIEGAIFVEESDFDEDELVITNWISETEVEATFIGALEPGKYDITVVDGLWTQKFVEGLEVLDPPESPPGALQIVTPAPNVKLFTPGDPVDVQVTVAVEGVELEPGGVHLIYYLDGVEKEITTQTQYTYPGVTPGRKLISVALVDANGYPLGSDEWKETIPIKVVTPCSVASECAESICANLACAGQCNYGPAYAGCCTNDIMCGPNSVCVSGTCEECEFDADCVEGDSCTVDRCVDGSCEHEEIANCCEADGDCDDESPCTTDFCITSIGECDIEIDTVEGCCTSSVECGDDNPCTIDFCISNECRYGPHPTLSSCCTTDADCLGDSICQDNHCIECDEAYNTACDDGEFCTVGSCDFITNKCTVLDVPNCCENGGDCDDGNSCTSNTCNQTFKTCFFGDPQEGCCDIDEHCDDGIPCNSDICLQGECRFGPDTANPDCCDPVAIGLSYLNCNDGNPCTSDICNPNTFVCSLNDPDGTECCTYSDECDDGDPATLNLCLMGECLYPVDPTYCENVLDCDDEDACTQAVCEDETCIFTPVPGCCTSNFNCIDSDKCTADTCDLILGLCTYEPVTNCCDVVADCPPPGPCQTVACAGNTCRYSDVSGCCLTGGACDDGNSCTDDICVENLCDHTPAPGCACSSDGDCDDDNICTTESCVDGICFISEEEDCCGSSADCNDGDSCTTDLCLAGTCKQVPKAGCCNANADCNDFDSCTADSCVSATCSYEDLDVCVEGTGILHTFTTGFSDEGFATDVTPKDVPGWTITDGMAALVLSAGPPVTWEATLASPSIDATETETLFLQWEQELPAAAGSPGDSVEVKLSKNGGLTWSVVYAHNPAGPGAPEWISIDISALMAGEADVRLAFVWEGGASSTGSYWKVDNVVIGAGIPPAFISQDELQPVIPSDTLTTIDVEAVDNDLDAVVTFSLKGAPDFAALDPDLAVGPNFTASLLLTPLYADKGAYTTTLIARDEQNLSATLEYTYTVD